MKKRLFAIIASILALVVVISVVVVAQNEGSLFRAGQALDQRDEGDTTVLARIQDVEITQAVVDYRKAMINLGYFAQGETEPTDQEVLDQLLKDAVWTLEAQKQGYVASQEEIDAYMADVRSGYTMPDGKAYVDEYCEGANMTVEEYFEEIQELAPEIIIRSKLRNEVLEEFCRQKGIDVAEAPFSMEAEEAFQKFLTQLFKSYESEIVYLND